MNKQELIGKIKEMLVFAKTISKISLVSQHEVIKLIEQLDEPQKPVVPQFVADWYEENKDDFEGNLFRFAHNIPSTFDGAKLNEFERWFLNASTKAFQTLVNMHQFGYEIEKEKRYLVKLKGMIEDFVVLKLDKIRDGWYLGNDTEYSYTKVKHTRKQLEEAGFGEVFNSSLFEVEEVE